LRHNHATDYAGVYGKLPRLKSMMLLAHVSTSAYLTPAATKI